MKTTTEEKKPYEELEFEVFRFVTEDIITTSNASEDDDKDDDKDDKDQPDDDGGNDDPQASPEPSPETPTTITVTGTFVHTFDDTNEYTTETLTFLYDNGVATFYQDEDGKQWWTSDGEVFQDA